MRGTLVLALLLPAAACRSTGFCQSDAACPPGWICGAQDRCERLDDGQLPDASTPSPDGSPAFSDGRVADAASTAVDGGGALPRSVVPSHVSPGRVRPLASDLSSAVALIDTGALVLRDADGAIVMLPPGGAFGVEGKSGVLSIGGWQITAPVKVVGPRNLVVVAAGDVVIAAPLRGSAQGAGPGPGGGLSGVGAGTGNAGVCGWGTIGKGGGGGGGFGVAGAGGGAALFFSAGTWQKNDGGRGGSPYASHLSDWEAGSGGGEGGGGGSVACKGGGCTGGAGGGAIQITSTAAITVQTGGLLSVNGGGGTGGCEDGAGLGGGGGGSGGTLFLESPTMVIAGGLYANGGAGGDPAAPMETGAPDGPESLLAAGAGKAHTGSGGARGFPPTTPADFEGSNGGGGGSTGRVWLRTRGRPATVSGPVSPVPMTDLSL